MVRLQCLLWIGTVITISADGYEGYNEGIVFPSLRQFTQGRYQDNSPIQRSFDRIPRIQTRIQDSGALNKRGIVTFPATDEPEGGIIVFERPNQASMAQVVTPPQITEECKILGYCPSVPNYPEEVANKIVEEVQDKNVFNIDEIDSDEDVQIAQRLGGGSDEIVKELCDFKVGVIFPQAAPDKNNQWHTVVNPKDNPVQGFKAETCTAANKGCTNMISVHNGYKTECRQKFVYRQMVTVDAAGNKNEHQLKLPSCCSCVIIASNPF